MNREQRRKSKFGAGPWIKPKVAKTYTEYIGDFGGIFAVCKKVDMSIGGEHHTWSTSDTRLKNDLVPYRVALISPEKGKEEDTKDNKV